MRLVRCKVVCRYLATACYLLAVVITVRLMFRDQCVEVPADPYAPPGDNARQKDLNAVAPERRPVDWTDEQPLQNSSRSDVLSGRPLAPPRTPCPSTHRRHKCTSDAIPYGRNLPDTRPHGCQQRPYPRDLSPVSLVVTSSASEHLSVILRGLYSIHHRTPTRLVHQVEFVLIPKASDPEKDLLAIEAAVTWHFPTLTTARSAFDEGLLGARKKGVERSTAEVIVFVHLPVEVNLNWLPPLLEPIAGNSRVVTTPVLDAINRTTFEYGENGTVKGSRLGFNWRLEEEWLDRSHVDEAAVRLPFPTPIADNRVFCISRAHWSDIEGYSEDLRPSGKGEHIELSLKTWLCGGEVKAVPCARVGVIPAGSSPTSDDVENYALVARRWMDEFGDFVLAEIGRMTGEVRESRAVTALKGRLVCKPFRWFLEKILPELITQHPPYRPAEDLGVVLSAGCGLCAAVGEGQAHPSSKILSLTPCSDPRHDTPTSFRMKKDGHLQLGDGRICLALSDTGGAVYKACSSISPNQLWEYNPISLRLTHQLTGRCLKATATCMNAVFPKFQSNDKYSKSTQWKWRLAKMMSDLLPPHKLLLSSKFPKTKTPPK